MTVKPVNARVPVSYALCSTRPTERSATAAHAAAPPVKAMVHAAMAVRRCRFIGEHAADEWQDGGRRRCGTDARHALAAMRVSGVSAVAMTTEAAPKSTAPARRILLRPPRNLTDRIDVESLDGRVGMITRVPVRFENRLGRLIGRRPHVGVDLGIVVKPRQSPVRRTTEHLTKVTQLDTRNVLHNAQQVRAGSRHRPTHVVFTQTIQFGQQLLTLHRQVPVESRFRCRGFGHAVNRKTNLRRFRFSVSVAPAGGPRYAPVGVRWKAVCERRRCGRPGGFLYADPSFFSSTIERRYPKPSQVSAAIGATFYKHRTGDPL